MSVRAIRPEGDYDVRLNTPQMFDDRRDGVPWVDAIKLLIPIVEQRNISHAQGRCGSAQLALANAAQFRRTWMLRIAESIIAIPSAIPARRREQRHLDAFTGVLSERAADA